MALINLDDSTLSYYETPYDPETGAAYEFKTSPTNTLSFELCAIFATPGPLGASNSGSALSYDYPETKRMISTNWQHGAGHTCFTRTIDPAVYPVTPALVPPTASAGGKK